MNVSYKIPAYLSNFSTLENGRTIAKLKVFYIGETADGRIFSKEFADKLVGTLPYCPVVAYYSDLKQDFNGHNPTQYIYGLVQPTAEYYYEADEEGKEWLITDVMLYTDRCDNIGEVAGKIVGHPHSLEMDPKTAKYKVFRENGRTKVEFTDGHLVGLSVLGSTQKPAFTGSEFFMATDFSDMRAKFENFFSCLEENSRGEQMEKEKFESFANFARLSYTEKMSMAERKLKEELGDDNYVCVVTMDDDRIVYYVYDYYKGTASYNRCSYTMTDVEFTVSNAEVVFPRYISAAEMDYLEGFGKSQAEESNMEVQEVQEEVEVVETTETEVVEATEIAEEEVVVEAQEEFEEVEVTEPEVEVEVAEAEEQPVNEMASQEEDEEEASDEEEETNCAESNYVDEEEEGEEEDDEQDSDEPSEEDSEEEETNHSLHNSSALSDSERIELENYRRKEKIALANSFADLVDSKTINEFIQNIDEYDYAELEAKLSIIHSKASRAEKAATPTSVTPMSFGSVGRKPKAKSYAELVAERLKK